MTCSRTCSCSWHAWGSPRRGPSCVPLCGGRAGRRRVRGRRQRCSRCWIGWLRCVGNGGECVPPCGEACNQDSVRRPVVARECGGGGREPGGGPGGGGVRRGPEQS